jgi:DNA-binding SARP family transcriptional activator
MIDRRMRGSAGRLSPKRWNGSAARLSGGLVNFSILGSLGVGGAGGPVPVSSARQRSVLAYLLIHAGRPVTTAALIDEVWGDAPPRTATNTLQTYTSQLRRRLRPYHPAGSATGPLRTVPSGYLLDIDPAQIDAARFEDALRDGRAALELDDADKAAARLRDGLSLWRGPALDNVAGATAASEAARLDELRLVALELRIEADLRGGRHDETVGELERLVRDHPWRERLAAQCMLALYRCGRQAEALARYREIHDGLVTELGICPGPDLRDLERRILRQDPALSLAPSTGRGAALPKTVQAAPPSSPAAPEAADRPGGRDPARPHRWRLLTGMAVAVAVALAVVGWVLTGGQRAASGRPSPARDSGILNEFDLAVRPGLGYDLDIPPGQPADWHSTSDHRSPDFQRLDLYRTQPAPDAPDAHYKISGMDLHADNQFNAMHVVEDGDGPQMCRRLPTGGGGNLRLSQMHAGTKVCVHTYENRWALLTVVRVPVERTADLLLHVVVLNP